MLEHLDLVLQLRIEVLRALILELVLQLFNLALLVLELLLQFRVLGSRFVPSLLRLFKLPTKFGFDGGRARLGGFIGSAGRDIVVRCASLGELFMWCKRGRGSRYWLECLQVRGCPARHARSRSDPPRS